MTNGIASNASITKQKVHTMADTVEKIKCVEMVAGDLVQMPPHIQAALTYLEFHDVKCQTPSVLEDETKNAALECLKGYFSDFIVHPHEVHVSKLCSDLSNPPQTA